MAKVRNCVWVSPSSILTIAHNLFRQFLNVTFNKIVCQLALFLFYETPPPDLLSSLLLVLLAGYFGFQVSARQLSAESVRGARFQAPDQLWSLALTVALSICYIRQANIWCCRLWVCISFAQAERKYQVIHQVLARASFWPFWRRHVTLQSVS